MCKQEHAWVEPPALTGSGTREYNGYSYVSLSNTELGKRVEHALAEHLGFRLAHPSVNQGAFDLLCGRDAYEVKAMTTGAREYKAKPAKNAVLRKLAAANEAGWRPNTLIAVVDATTKTVRAYARAGLGAFRLTGPERGWSYLGEAPINLEAR